MNSYVTNSTSATVGASDATVLGTNLGRDCLIVSPPNAGRVTLQFGRAAVIDQGITLQAGVAPIAFQFATLGDAIRGEIHAIGDAAGRTFGLTEVFAART